MNKDRFECRGISEKKKYFLYGYYFYDEEEDKHKMIVNEHIDYDGSIEIEREEYELIKEPDMCLCKKDKDGKVIYENDKLYYNGKLIIGKGEFKVSFCNGGFYIQKIETGLKYAVSSFDEFKEDFLDYCTVI